MVVVRKLTQGFIGCFEWREGHDKIILLSVLMAYDWLQHSTLRVFWSFRLPVVTSVIFHQPHLYLYLC